MQAVKERSYEACFIASYEHSIKFLGLFTIRTCSLSRLPRLLCYDDPMAADGPLHLDDRTVWYSGGHIHREDGPAVEFKDGRQLWALNGHEVTEQEVTAHRLENERQARARSDEMWQSHEAEQLRQYHTGLDHPVTVKHALNLQPKKTEETD